mgnify:CR=1 FL=1
MARGEWPRECAACEQAEQQGRGSLRESYWRNYPRESTDQRIATWQHTGRAPDPVSLDLAVGNTCNLKCRQCNAEWSSAIAAEQGVKVARPQAPQEWYATLPKEPLHTIKVQGGEPLLQDNITGWMQRQLSHYKAVQVESNGVPETLVPKGVTLVCSPKCIEKNGKPVKYLAPSKTILQRADCLKFVVSADPESPYSTVPDWAFEWKRNNPDKEVYCSPMNIYNNFPQRIKLLRAEKGTITMAERSTVDEVISFWEPGLLDLKANQANHEYVGQFCIENGFKLNLQQHLYASLA